MREAFAHIVYTLEKWSLYAIVNIRYFIDIVLFCKQGLLVFSDCADVFVYSNLLSVPKSAWFVMALT